MDVQALFPFFLAALSPSLLLLPQWASHRSCDPTESSVDATWRGNFCQVTRGEKGCVHLFGFVEFWRPDLELLADRCENWWLIQSITQTHKSNVYFFAYCLAQKEDRGSTEYKTLSFPLASLHRGNTRVIPINWWPPWTYGCEAPPWKLGFENRHLQSREPRHCSWAQRSQECGLAEADLQNLLLAKVRLCDRKPKQTCHLINHVTCS